MAARSRAREWAMIMVADGTRGFEADDPRRISTDRTRSAPRARAGRRGAARARAGRPRRRAHDAGRHAPAASPRDLREREPREPGQPGAARAPRRRWDGGGLEG